VSGIAERGDADWPGDAAATAPTHSAAAAAAVATVLSRLDTGGMYDLSCGLIEIWEVL
jgi:hypothetical protein